MQSKEKIHQTARNILAFVDQVPRASKSRTRKTQIALVAAFVQSLPPGGPTDLYAEGWTVDDFRLGSAIGSVVKHIYTLRVEISYQR